MKTHNIFISHFHKDEKTYRGLVKLLKDRPYFRFNNFSVDPSHESNASNEEYIKTLLRPKIKPCSTLLVLIGPETHKRPWVNWEIEYANREGKRIVGVFEHGGKESDVPKAFNRYGNSLVGWNRDSIVDAIRGENKWYSSTGEPRQAYWAAIRGCN